MKKSKMPQIGEAIFSIIYLVFGFIASFILLSKSNGRNIIQLYGILTLVLAGGDSFHLVPRIINALKEKIDGYEFWAGLGLMISSITMTVFYILLYYVWKAMHPTIQVSNVLISVFMICAILRILLCLFPQNNWLKKEGNPTWGILRNIPFAIVGLIMVYLFILGHHYSMAIAIVISFACYFPVVLWAKKNPKIGMMMIPKTMAYMWMIGIGLMML